MRPPSVSPCPGSRVTNCTARPTPRGFLALAGHRQLTYTASPLWGFFYKVKFQFWVFFPLLKAYSIKHISREMHLRQAFNGDPGPWHHQHRYPRVVFPFQQLQA